MTRASPPGAGSPPDAGGFEWAGLQMRGVEFDERFHRAQPRHRHVQALALLEGQPTHRPLGQVRVGLYRLSQPPGVQLEQPRGRRLGPDEVRNATAGAWESRNFLLLQQPPDRLADPLFLHRRSPAIRPGRLSRSISPESARLVKDEMALRNPPLPLPRPDSAWYNHDSSGDAVEGQEKR